MVTVKSKRQPKLYQQQSGRKKQKTARLEKLSGLHQKLEAINPKPN